MKSSNNERNAGDNNDNQDKSTEKILSPPNTANGLTNEIIFSSGSSVISESDTEALDHQIAGHSRIGILKHKSGSVLKPLQKEPLGSREVNFYKQVFGLSSENKEHSLNSHEKLKTFVPKFHGMSKIEILQDGGRIWNEYLVLDDIIDDFIHPSVMDIKIGTQTWDFNASKEKIEYEKSKYKGTKGPLGLSLAGMQFYDLNLKKNVRMDKDLGKTLVESSFIDQLEIFFNRAYDELSPKVIAKKLIPRLKEILDYFETQREFNFYSSSLLIAYDATKCLEFCKEINSKAGPCGDEILTENNSKGNDCNNSSWLRVWMIDFAHVIPNEGNEPDANYIHGLRNLIRIFNGIGSDR